MPKHWLVAAAALGVCAPVNERGVGHTKSEAAVVATEIELVILEILKNAAEALGGLQIVEASNDRVKPGSVYVIADRMVSQGWLRKERRALPGVAGMKRVYFAITDAGQRALQTGAKAQRDRQATQVRLAEAF